MSKLGFTKEEQTYVARVASINERGVGRVWFYSAVLVPAIAFGVYGIVRSDLIALGLAFAALVYFAVWRIVGEVRNAPVFFSIFSKIVDYEKKDGA